MKEIKKFILLKGKVETLSFFSECIKEELEKRGMECFLFDFDREMEDFLEMVWFTDETTALLTFNFIGLSGEEIFETQEGNFWKQRDVMCINILVDHPFYYHKQFSELAEKTELNEFSGKFEKYIQFCVDRDHVAYCKRFFSEIQHCFFINLAGSCIGYHIPFKERSIDVMFAGNYTPLENFSPYINRTGKENADFYFEILDYLKAYPNTEITVAIEKFLRRDFPDVTEEEIKGCMGNSMFLDLYIRFYYRGEVIKKLIENGIKVHVFGSGWDLLPTISPENLIIHGQRKTKECLEAMENAKISFNIMPWFKEGAHDRIFSSMLSGCVCFTDKSRYLTESFKEDKELVFYDLAKLDMLPKLVKSYLENPSLCEKIGKRGRTYGSQNETWKNRTEEILEKLKLIRSI